MAATAIPKSVAKAIDAYHDTLKGFAQQYALHEGAVLLSETARAHHWTLIPQLTAKAIRPDGTLKDPMGLVRRHWEAKDTKDDLDVEIEKKTRKGYPLANIIFEDTRAYRSPSPTRSPAWPERFSPTTGCRSGISRSA